MQRAREIIRKVLGEAESPALLWSAGKDSMLLLHLIREIKNIPVIWWHQGMTGEQEQFAKEIIQDLDLDVWSWAPTDVYVIPNDKGLSLVSEQSFGTQRFPVIRDIEDGPRCIGDYPEERTERLFPHFSDLFIGYRDTDTHFSLGGSNFCPPDGWTLGRSKVYAPLRHLSDTEVWEAIRELNVPVDERRYAGDETRDGGSYFACTACLQKGSQTVFCPKEQREIERVNWNPEESLSTFQRRFGFKETVNVI